MSNPPFPPNFFQPSNPSYPNGGNASFNMHSQNQMSPSNPNPNFGNFVNPPPNMYPNQPMFNPNQTNINGFSLIGRGNGIDDKEFYVITHSANDALIAREDPLSNGVIKRIKNQIGGEWMVFASIEGLKGYDFSLSIVTGNDFLSFIINNFRFQVCRLRD